MKVKTGKEFHRQVSGSFLLPLKVLSCVICGAQVLRNIDADLMKPGYMNFG